MRFIWLQSIVCRVVRGSSGSHGAARPRFRLDTSFFQADRPPPFARRVHSLVRPVLFGVRSPSFFAPLLSVRRALPWGFVPLRGITGGVHERGASQSPASFRPQVFSTSRRLAPPTGFAGLFHPAATSRVSVQGFVPDSQLCRLVAGPCLLAFIGSALTGCPAATRHRPDFEALLRGSICSSKSVVSLLRRHCPSSVFSSRLSRSPVPRASPELRS